MPLKVSPLTGAGMVVQQGAAVPVRGEAAPGAEIAVSFAGKTYHAEADSNGAWRILLDASAPGGPYAMEIAAEGGGAATGERIALDDIYVGDVWLCAGQSNMELPMARLKDDFPEEWQPPVNPFIRQFKVPQEWEFSGPRAELSGGCWKAAAAGADSAETLDEFFGTAWFFARALYERQGANAGIRAKTPVGLIGAAWGGTPIEAWMSREALAAAAAAATAASASAAPLPAKTAEGVNAGVHTGDRYADAAKCAEIERKASAAIQEWEDNAAAADLGLAEAWQTPETDTAAWGDITLPGDFAAASLAGFCGALWLAKDFEAPAAFAAEAAKIWLGTIVDADTVYINGVEVGNTAYRYPPRKYAVPAGLLQAGKNRVTIRVTCNNGGGGVTRGKPFRIFTRNKTVELAGTWKYRVGAAAGQRPAEFFFQRQSMGLFNAMIAPLLGYPLKGVIWYQGESNDPNPHEYAALFPALINDWRGGWKSRSGLESPLPFLFVQLPIFGAPGDNDEASPWAIIREAQAQALALPATGMAAGLDLGEWNDLHPVNKKGIGQRLALAAEKAVYGQPNTSPGPTARAVERRGKRLVITFDNCGDGLRIHLTENTEVMTNIEWVFNAEPVKQLEGTEFSKSETDLITQVDDFFKSIGRKAEREGLGVVELTRHGIRDSIAHGIGREKSAAFAAVPDVIQHGKIIDHQTNWKGRGYDTYVIDAPIKIGNVNYIAEVIIEQNQSKHNEFYLHEVEIKEKAQNAFKTGMDTGAPQASSKEAQSAFKTATERSAPQASRLIITRKLKEVKENSAKFTDKNPYVSLVAAGGRVFRAAAEIDGPDCISIDLSAVENPEKLLYAWANNPKDRQLFNSDGLPVIPFQVKIP